MLFSSQLWWAFCLSSIVVSASPYQGSYPLLIRDNTTGTAASAEDTLDASSSSNDAASVLLAEGYTVPSGVANLCALGSSNDTTSTDSPVSTASPCSDCITTSGVIIGTSIPTTLVPENQTETDSTSATATAADSKRGIRAAVPAATLAARSPALEPLADPSPDDQEDFMSNIWAADGTLDIGISPQPEQISQWTIPLTIGGKTVNTPIGVTGIWTPWPATATNYRLVGMSGCTAVLIIGNTGFWAGHWWESNRADNVNGGATFNYRYGAGDTDVMVRPLADFKTIGTNILAAAAPAGAVSFESLLDLENNRGDPFGRSSGGGDIYIITKSAGTSNTQQAQVMYSDQVSALKTAIQKFVRPSTVNMRTYIGDKSTFTQVSGGEQGDERSPAGVPLYLNGVSILQYSPYAGTDKNGCPQACARVWEELNTAAAVDRSWPANIGSSNKRNAACAIGTISSTPTSTPSSLPCYPYADPDNGVAGGCMCSNGVMVSAVTGTGLNGNICPWTTLPSQALTTAKPITNTPQYQFTETDISSKVIECQSYSTQNYAGFPVSFCAGSSAVLYEPPVASMELGSSKVNVASMTGEQLFTSVSNAVMSLCPTPTSEGAFTSCQTGSVTIGKADFIENGKPTEGDVTLHLTDTQYNSSDFLNLFVNMLAGGANASASGTNCAVQAWNYFTETKRDIAGRLAVPDIIPHDVRGNGTFCNINSFFDTQFYDGIQETALMWFEAEFGFELGELGNFDCESTVGTVGAVLGAIFDAIFPEFAWLVESGVELGEIACEAAETFNSKSTSKRELEAEREMKRLAKAWEKEKKKDRRLPMPEHKKKELGLV